MRQAAFVSEHHENRQSFLDKWNRLLINSTVHSQSIFLVKELIGHVAKYEMDGQAQLTYWIASAHWGKGYASQAVQAFLNMEFQRPIFARVAIDNFASKSVLEKNGFSPIGKSSYYAQARGTEIDELIYCLD